MKLTAKQRAALKQKYSGKCAYCGCELPDRWHADHLEPVERKLKYVSGKGVVATGEMWNPDADNLGNLMPACPACNIDKHALPLESWRRQVQDSCNILARNSTTYRRAMRFGMVEETGRTIRFYFEQLEGQGEGGK